MRGGVKPDFCLPRSKIIETGFHLFFFLYSFFFFSYGLNIALLSGGVVLTQGDVEREDHLLDWQPLSVSVLAGVLPGVGTGPHTATQCSAANTL